MFVVKHVDSDGNESLFHADEVHAKKYGTIGLGGFDGPSRDLYEFVSYLTVEPGGLVKSSPIGSGTVYVMNSDGKTVDRYHLAGVSPDKSVAQPIAA